MVRAYVVLPLLALASGCAVIPDVVQNALWWPGKNAHEDDISSARIARGVTLQLPTAPSYPEEATVVQTGRAQFGQRQAAFEAVMELGPDKAQIVLMMPSGPRLSTITWDETGVHEERAPFVPDSLPVENILADIFVTVWPADVVSAALPENATLSVDEAGVRRIHRGDDIVLTVTPDPADPTRIMVRNEAYGYEVAIVSQIETAASVAAATAASEAAPASPASSEDAARRAPQPTPEVIAAAEAVQWPAAHESSGDNATVVAASAEPVAAETGASVTR